MAALAALLLTAPALSTPHPPQRPPSPLLGATWTEVRSDNFIVFSDSGERPARQVALQFEQFRAALQSLLKDLRLDPGQPFLVLAVREERSLRQLLPGYWERKGGARPAGLFVPGAEKHYAVLRLDATGEFPYKTVYHEYVHLIVRINLGRVPVWMNEGLAEFYAHATLGRREVGLGQPPASHLGLLNREKLLPLEVLFAVDYDSPHYNEANKVSIFYAQSWALMHQLIVADKGAYNAQLQEYARQLRQGADSLDAARAAFGNLAEMEKRLRRYVEQHAYYYYKLPAPVRPEESFAARKLAPAEAAALLGDFYVHTRRPEEARTALEYSMQLDPGLAAPRESFGVMAFHNRELPEAARWFAEAVRLDSRSFLAHYYHGMLSLMSPESFRDTDFATSEQAFRRAIELKPAFGPAYANLVQLYLRHGERLDEALELARKAVELEPGQIYHRLNLVALLLRTEKLDDASRELDPILAAARSGPERQIAETLHREIESWKRTSQEREAYEAVRREGNLPRRAWREPELQEAAKAEPPPRETEKPAETKGAGQTPDAPRRAITAPGEGTVTGVTCNGPEMRMVLTYYGHNLELRAKNYFEVEFLTANWKAPADFNPCRHLKGRYVKVEYVVVTGQPYAGEFVSVEVVK